MRMLVIGAGAIGSVVGGLLAEAGHDITLLGRAWHLDAIRRQGLRISGLWGEHLIRRLATATHPDQIPRPRAFDWVLLCVKAHQTAAATDILKTVLGPHTLVCALQNGLGNYETLTRAIPSSRVALGRVIFGVEIEPGHARVTVCADEVVVGAPDAQVPRERIAALAAALQAGGIPARATEAILPVLWAKLLYNCALNGLSALLEAPYGALAACEMSRRLIRQIIEEAYQVAGAHRIPLEPPTAEAYHQLLMTRLIPSTAAHYASMLHDLRHGKPTEIDALNGALVRLAVEAGLAAPANALVTRLVHVKEQFAGVAAEQAVVANVRPDRRTSGVSGT